MDDGNTLLYRARSSDMQLHGQVLCKATNMEGLEQLQKFTLNTTGRNLGGLHFHTLLVLKRLALNSRLFFHYLTALASNLWNGFKCQHKQAPSRNVGHEANIGHGRLLSCYEVLLQLPPIVPMLAEQPQDIGDLARGIARIFEALCASELDFDAIRLGTWICHWVSGESTAVCGEAAGSSHCFRPLFFFFAQSTREEVRQQIQSMSKVVGTVETPLFAGNGFHRAVLLNLLPGIGAFEESIANASTDASASRKQGKSAKKPTVYGTITMTPSALESVLVALLSEGVMPPSISASFLGKAVSSYSQLLQAKVKRGLDIASRCYQRGNEPPLAFAVGRASAETVECMLASGAGQDRMNVQCSPSGQAQLTAKVESRWRSQAPANDLPDITVRRENCRILRALHHSGICATNPATLFEAALYSNPDTLEFLLNTQSWSPVDVRDALCLQSAICLVVSLSPRKSFPAHLTDEYSGTSPHQCPACRNELDFRHSLACPVLSTAFQMFPHPAAVASEANPPQSTATEPRALSLQQSIGQDIREAHSKEEL